MIPESDFEQETKELIAKLTAYQKQYPLSYDGEVHLRGLTYELERQIGCGDE